MKIIDVNAAFGFWPIQRLSTDSLAKLDAKYASVGVGEVWLSAVESILYPEPDTWDDRLFEQLGAYPRFRAVKTVNPLLANWRKSWADARAPLVAIKLFPNYHGYALTDKSVDEVCTEAARENLPVLIQMRVNDERNQPHFLQVRGVSAEEVAALSRRHPDTRMIALCAYTSEITTLAKGGDQLMAELSFLDSIVTLDRELRTQSVLERQTTLLPPQRIVFGSGEAFVHVHAALLKLHHANLPANVTEAIASGNAEGHRLAFAKTAPVSR